MSPRLPFTATDIHTYPPYSELKPDVQDKLVELLDEEALNEKGDLKRSPNAFFIFRREYWKLIKQHRESEGTHQADVSMSAQYAWARLTPAEKEPYEKARDEEKRKLMERFPPYQYLPTSDAIWRSLTREGKNRFWFESVVGICEKMLEPNSEWQRLIVEDWIEEPWNKDYIKPGKDCEALSGTKPAGRQASRGSGSTEGTAASKSGGRPRDASHPYDRARANGKAAGQENSSNDQIEEGLNLLKTKLLPLGPRPSNGLKRRLVLSSTQLVLLNKVIYVEEEIPHGTNLMLVNMMMEGQEVLRNADDVIILKDYTNPGSEVKSAGDPPTPPDVRDSAADTAVCRDITNTPSPATPSLTFSPTPDGVIGAAIPPLLTPTTGNRPVIPSAPNQRLASNARVWPAPHVSVDRFQSSRTQVTAPSTSRPLHPVVSNKLQLAYAIPHFQPANTPQAVRTALAWPAPPSRIPQSQSSHPPTLAPAPEASMSTTQPQTPYDQATHSLAQDASTLPTSQPLYPMASSELRLTHTIPHSSQPVNVPAQFASTQDSSAMNQCLTSEGYQGLGQGALAGPSNQEQASYYQDNWNNTYGDNVGLDVPGPVTHHQESLQSVFEFNFGTQAQVPSPTANAPNSQVEETIAAAASAYLNLDAGSYFDFHDQV